MTSRLLVADLSPLLKRQIVYGGTSALIYRLKFNVISLAAAAKGYLRHKFQQHLMHLILTPDVLSINAV